MSRPGALHVALALTFAAAVITPAQETAGPPRPPIRGRVVDAQNGAVLRRARVTLESGGKPVDTVFSDDDGSFALTPGAAARSTLRIVKAGYAQVVLPVEAGGDPGASSVALVRSAVVTGRVLDLYGAPVADAYVTGRLFSPDAARTSTASRQFHAMTDRLGEYRLAGLPPGRYEIRGVRIPPELMAPGTRVEERLFGPPDALETADGGTSMTLAPGAEVANVDFALRAPREVCATGPSVRPADGVAAGAIAGRVTAATGEPLICAAVRIVSPDAPVPHVYTDRQGRFLFDGLPANGSFIVEARAVGYASLQHGQRRPADPEVPIVVRAGGLVERADIVLPRDSIVGGTVRDEHGEPVEGIQVWAFQLRRVGGRTSTVSTVFSRPTDDRGRFRLIGVAPGEYVVAALVRGVVGTGRAYGSTYHPGVRDAAMAQRVPVDLGADVHGVDIVLAASTTATVTGVAADVGGRPFAGAVSLTASGRSGVVSLDSWSAAADGAGAFAFRDVPPGDYVLKATGPPGGPPQFGMQYVTVIDGDPPPARVTVTAGSTLEGRAIVESTSVANLAGLAVGVVPADLDFSPVAGIPRPDMYARQDDGTFRSPGVFGSGRLVIEMPACEGCYLVSARVNGVDASDVPFDFGAGGTVYRDVEVVVSDAGATIAGRVEDAGAPVSSYSVLVMPTNREWWHPRSRHMKVGRPAADGAFALGDLPPGDYFVAAVNRLDAGGPDLYDLEAFGDLASRGVRVSVGPRERRTVELRLIRR